MYHFMPKHKHCVEYITISGISRAKPGSLHVAVDIHVILCANYFVQRDKPAVLTM